MIDTKTADKIAQDVVNCMLAPEHWEATDLGGPFRFMRKATGELELHLYLKWSCDERSFLKPDHLVQDLERLFEVMSKRITYGEVVDLRENFARVSKRSFTLQKRVDELQNHEEQEN